MTDNKQSLPLRGKIPKFKTTADEAKFWDTHDVTDFLNELKFTDTKFVKKPRQMKNDTITIRVEPQIKEQLELLSVTYGVNISTLSRMWIMEKLFQQKIIQD